MFFGTGKPPWQRIGHDDVTRTIDTIKPAGPKKMLLVSPRHVRPCPGSAAQGERREISIRWDTGSSNLVRVHPAVRRWHVVHRHHQGFLPAVASSTTNGTAARYTRSRRPVNLVYQEPQHSQSLRR